jgi:low affinity Fe/Cu permease
MDKQLWVGVAVVVVGYVIGFYFQRRDIDKLEASLNRRIDDLRSEMVARFEGLRDLLRSEIKRVEERIERLEHPVARG